MLFRSNYACYNESQILVLNQNSDYEIYDYSNIVNGMYPFIPKTFVWDPNYITSPFMQLEGHTITISEQGKKFQIIYENTTTDFSFFFEVIIEYNQSGILQYGKIEQEIVEIATGHRVFQRNMIEYLIVETASDLPKEDKGLLDEITGYPLSMITFSILLGFPGLGFLINRKRQF